MAVLLEEDAWGNHARQGMTSLTPIGLPRVRTLILFIDSHTVSF